VRALLRTDRADDELAHALAAAGLYVERISSDDAAARLGDARGDLAVIDPRLLPHAKAPPRQEKKAAEPSVETSPLEELCYRRLAVLLDKLDGGTLPELYATAMAQSERALLRLAIDRTRSLSAGAELLGIHRNTLVRRLDELGLRQRDDADGAEPRAGKRREAKSAPAAKASAPRKARSPRDAASGRKPKSSPRKGRKA